MTSEQFRAARAALGMTQAQLAAALEIHVFTIKCYERGTWADGRPAPVPRAIALALEALQTRAQARR
jgi:DNA-binding XRE family transcriptional regulator